MDVARHSQKIKLPIGVLTNYPSNWRKESNLIMPLHAGWIVDFYKEMTTPNGMKITEIGWTASGIHDAISLVPKIYTN